MRKPDDIEDLAGINRATGRIDPDRMAENARRVAGGFWSKLAAVLSRVPFADEAVAAYCCTRDPQTPTRVRAILLAALAYFVLPTDAMPDFVALFGFTDDAAVLLAALKTVSGHVREEHRTRARQMLAAVRRGDVPSDEGDGVETRGRA